jgi:rod shape determining protein RodA
MFDRQLLTYFDWGLLALIFLISGIGVVILYSSLHGVQALHPPVLFYRQLIWLAMGFSLMCLMFMFHFRHLIRWAPVIYLATVILLLSVHLFGKHVGGSTRWLPIGPFSFQPSEPAKLAVIIMLARYYTMHAKASGLTLSDLIFPILITAVPFFLIVTQPDLGTAGMILIVAGSMTLFSKIDRRAALFFIILAVVFIPVGWELLEPYQKERILTLIFPDKDPLGAGYHIRQSKIAVGSGMLLGKGYLQGTQKMLAFLPEQHTDFIFSVLTEEWGFIGSLVILFLFLLLTGFGLSIAHGCRNSGGTLMAVGITALIFWQTIINIAMVTGMFPVVGMPLPLISYGGSSILTIFLGLGILLNISMRRFTKE